MKEKILNTINNNDEIVKTKKEELKYGLECICSFLEKFVILLILSLLFKTTKVFMLIMLFFTPLRIFGFGYHAKNNFQCWLISLFLYSLIPILINIIKISTIVINIGAIFASIIILIFAPASSVKKPLKNKSKNKKRKSILFFTCLIYWVIIIFINNSNLKECILMALTFEALLVSPLLCKPPISNRTLLNNKSKV